MNEILWMIILVVIIVIIVSLFTTKDSYLESMRPMIYQILLTSLIKDEISGLNIKHIDMFDNIQFRKSKDKTFTIDKQKIYIVTERISGRPYNQDTILFVLLHEVAHILSPDEHHTKTFFEIEKKLHQNAIELGFLTLSNVEKDYPCI